MSSYLRARRAWRGLLVAYTALVLTVTWWPSPGSTAAPGWAAAVLSWSHAVGVPLTYDVLEALANVLMFAPLGALLTITSPARRARRAAASAVAAGAALSVVVECVQLLVPGRFSTVQDVVMNTLGAAVGAALVLVCRYRPLTPAHRDPTVAKDRSEQV